jgi:hypothetical protein
MYASDHDDFYPVRMNLEFHRASSGFPEQVAATPSWDDRPHFDPYMFMNELTCPFVVHPEPIMDQSGTLIASYNYYFGFQADAANKAMKRPGDKMSLGEVEFDIVVSDSNLAFRGSLAAFSHPDRSTGGLIQRRFFNIDKWMGTTHIRGPVDMNSGRTDGSVFTVQRVDVEDGRLDKFYYRHGNNGRPTSSRWTLLPSVNY